MPGRLGIGCILCGARLTPDRELWMSEFRAVYTKKIDIEKPRLSGVGVRAQSTDLAPINPRARYSDTDPGNIIDIFFTKEFLLHEYSGFASHEACWQLLQKLRQTATVDISSLFLLCLSMPMQGGIVNWGHDYGGILKYKHSPVLPGEETTFSGYEHFIAGDEDGITSIQNHDPLKMPNLVSNPKATSPSGSLRISSGAENLKLQSKGDCFSSIPLELLQLILQSCTSSDVLNLKLASPTFARFPLTEAFWASRFCRGFELHHIFEAAKLHTQGHTWRDIYSDVRAVSRSSSLANRARIWNLILLLEQHVHNASTTTLYGSPVWSCFEHEASKDSSRWMYANAYISSARNIRTHGCWVLRTRTVSLPDEIKNTICSVVTLFGKSYVSGLRFLATGQPDCSIGYFGGGKEILMPITPKPHGTYRIAYFYLAIDPRGIRAIRLVNENGQSSSWAGDAEGVPIMRLRNPRYTKAMLRADFDALKLLSLAVPQFESVSQVSSGLKVSNEGHGRSLREYAQWYPNVPDENLIINDNKRGTVPDHYCEYRPLTTLIFGGMRGENLSRLVKIAVVVNGVRQIHGIYFTYIEAVDGMRTHTLGRPPPHDYSFTDDEYFEFSINGPGGELISSAANLWSDVQNTDGAIAGIEMYTNFGRRAVFPPDMDHHVQISRLEAEDSSTIVGLYAPLSMDVVVWNIGVLSVKLP